MNVYIYELVCPIKNEPLYVGKTMDLCNRYGQHKSNIINGKSKMSEYFKLVGVMPTINVIEKLSVSCWWDKKAAKAEAICIDAYISYGFELFNANIPRVSFR